LDPQHTTAAAQLENKTHHRFNGLQLAPALAESKCTKYLQKSSGVATTLFLLDAFPDVKTVQLLDSLFPNLPTVTVGRFGNKESNKTVPYNYSCNV